MKLTQAIIYTVPFLQVKMKYGHITSPELLFQIKIEDYIGIGLNLGSHPCCYVANLKESLYSKKDIESLGIYPHGGFTFGGKIDKKRIVLPQEEYHNLYWLGWDYSHAGDYHGHYRVTEGKKWDTPILVEHTKEIINQFKNEFK